MCVILGLCTVPAAMANSSSSKALRFTVVRRTAHFIIIKRHAHRHAIRRGRHVVTLKGHERYKYVVVKRTRCHIVLRRLSRSETGMIATLTIISPNSGSFACGTSTTIAWGMANPVSTGSFRVSLKSTSNGASTKLPAGNLSVVPGQTAYSVPWNVTQAVGTYRLAVCYCRWGNTAISSDVSDGTIAITPTSTPTRH